MAVIAVYVLRHGEFSNPANILPLRTPRIHLSPMGFEQIAEVTRLLIPAGIKTILTSPILRCRQSARIVGSQLHLPVRVTPSLIETLSPFQGMPLKEFEAKGYNTFEHPEAIRRGGETIADMYHRMKQASLKIIRTGKNGLLVSHGDPIMSLIAGEVYGSAEVNIVSSLSYIPISGLICFKYENSRLSSFNAINYLPHPPYRSTPEI